jgi:hypothetical protein
MRETFTSGSVGRAPGNRCLYPEPDRLQRPLRSRFRRQVSASVRVSAGISRHSGEGCKSQTVKVQPTTLAPSHAQASVTVSAQR